ncbi:BA75_02019T0 [Komagataella pastoris]|uniref:BA75_02019T0 n=1 Tax=Komagataella pastoris TaxID=4922 RepID=A0A1B2JCP1_PICPA|nr:BA75_02019T0 [Komagataella pastoris]
MARPKRPPPEGFQNIEPTLLQFSEKLKEIENTKSKTISKKEALWPIYQVHHQRSRYIYELYYKRKMISKELLTWLLKNKYADQNLIAKWRKKGYEKLCCLRCIQSDENNQKNTCICRVPKEQLDKELRCVTCGCKGCASGD